ncbi:MAG TPA: amidohydrolase family protein [Vicinamibacteria bacterium]|jgi:cytosine/adenosine deaminase-related metal-dependent hydrolase|nr:amidohydrolase family protein [Vicinamibacteria bacterium]
MNGPSLFTTSWVLPVSRPPLRDGWVEVRNGRVSALGAGESGLAARPLGPGILLPGLVNAHCHLELSHLENAVDTSRGFVPWVEELVATRGRLSRERVRDAAQRGIDALVASGTVAVGDVSNGLDHLDLLAASPLRSVVFFELLAWDPATADAVLRAAQSRLLALPSSLAGVEVRLGAHAPHSVSGALLRRLSEDKGLATLHLAESPAEVRFLLSGGGEWRDFLERRGLGKVAFEAPGMSPVRYLHSLGVLRKGLLAAHCVQTDPSDFRLLREAGVHVVVCPRSNERLGVGLPPVPALLEAGVNVCLGTDSLASAPTLSVWDDLLALRAAFPAIAPETLLRMATLAGAEALGLADLGSLEVGQAAAFAFVPLEEPPADPFAALMGARPQRFEA